MSETISSPERKDPLHIEGIPDALQVEMIDELRKAQTTYENKLVDAARKKDPLNTEAQEAARTQAHNDFDEMIEKHLASKGVAVGDPKYAEYATLLRSYSVDHIPENIWKDGQRDDDGKQVVPVMRDAAYTEVKGRFAIPTPEPAPPEPTPEPEPAPEPTPEPAPVDDPDKDKDKKKTPEEIKEEVDKDPAVVAARQNVDNLRSQLAKLSAKRQGRLFNREGGKLQQEYDEVQAKYEKAVSLLVQIELTAEKTAGVERDEDGERLEAAFRVVKQFRDLQAEAVETLKNTKVGKMITWLTTGGTVKRLAKGLLVGGAVGAVGAAITMFTLGTAGGAVGAGLAVVGTRAAAFARGFAAFDNKEGRGMGVVDIKDKDNNDDINSAFNLKTLKESGAEGKSRDEAVNLVHKHLLNRLESDTKQEQGKRRKSTFKALGVVAIGATLAEGINLGVNAYTGHINGAHETIFGNQDANATPGGPTPPAEVAPPPVPEKVFAPEALNIKAGEGWYQTFQDMGIPKDQWHDLLGKVGPQLHDIQVDGHPLAYQMPNGDWGIRMTPDGQMPKAALELISQTHDQMNGITPATTGVEATASTPSGAGVAEAASTTPNAPANVDTLTAPADHGGIQNIIHKQVIQPSDIQGNPNFNTFTHVAGMTPEMMAQHLGLRVTEWDQLQDYVARQVTSENNPLYRNVFTITTEGFLRFITSDIPPATMADMLTNGIPIGVRARL